MGDFEEPVPLGRNWEGVCRVIRAPDELGRVSGDSAEEMDPLEITDEVRSHDLIVRLHNTEPGEERVGVTYGRGRRANDVMGRERLAVEHIQGQSR